MGPHWCLQPRATQVTPLQAAETDASGTESELAADELSQPLCESANQGMLWVCGASDLVACLVGAALAVGLKRRLRGSSWSRPLGGATLAAVLATGWLAWDPLLQDTVLRCSRSAEFQRYIWFAGSHLGRALVLGAVPCLVLGLVLAWLADRAQ